MDYHPKEKRMASPAEEKARKIAEEVVIRATDSCFTENARRVPGRPSKLIWIDVIAEALLLATQEATEKERERAGRIARSFIEKGAYANTCLDISRAIETPTEERRRA